MVATVIHISGPGPSEWRKSGKFLNTNSTALQYCTWVGQGNLRGNDNQCNQSVNKLNIEIGYPISIDNMPSVQMIICCRDQKYAPYFYPIST